MGVERYEQTDAGCHAGGGYARAAAAEKGLSQEVLSGLADIGRSHLSAIERGERKPTMETFFRICCAMDMRMSDVALLLEQRLEKEQ